MAIPAALAFLADNPLIASQLAGVGYGIISRLTGSETPLRETAAQQVAVGEQLIPQLQAQAKGQPTVATRAQMAQLQQQANRAQQSYGASARRQGISGTTPARAQQGRIQAAQQQALGNLLGQSQLAAQQGLMSIYSQGTANQLAAEEFEYQREQDFGKGFARSMSWYREQKDPEAQEMWSMGKQLMQAIIALGLK
jgi:hypothetical protein